MSIAIGSPRCPKRQRAWKMDATSVFVTLVPLGQICQMIRLLIDAIQ